MIVRAMASTRVGACCGASDRRRNRRSRKVGEFVASGVSLVLDWPEAIGPATPTPRGGIPMKRLMAITLLGACAAFALPAAATENPQQERMKTCNAKAEGKKGDERKAFMSDCLSNEK